MDKHNDIWIQIQQNQCYRPEGIDVFIQDIEKSYRVQKRKKWLPAECEDNELWISILLNSPIMALIRDAIAGGMIFDIAKYAY